MALNKDPLRYAQPGCRCASASSDLVELIGRGDAVVFPSSPSLQGNVVQVDDGGIAATVYWYTGELASHRLVTLVKLEKNTSTPPELSV